MQRITPKSTPSSGNPTVFGRPAMGANQKPLCSFGLASVKWPMRPCAGAANLAAVHRGGRGAERLRHFRIL
jgi:hypothetical protein